jgi:pimeloyl-ACP methyl ester carboxylesterase
MAYARKITVTVDHTKVSGGADLSNFTIPVSLTNAELKTTGNGGQVTSASGHDIAPFSDASCVSMLKFHRVSYDASAGTWIAWVKLPTASASVDTVFYIGYGNAAVTTDQSDKVNAWDASTPAAYPTFGDGTSVVLTDHSGSFALTNSGSVTRAAGLIGDAASCNGTSQYMERSASAPVTTYPLTIESLNKPSASITTNRTIVGLNGRTGTALGFEIRARTTDAVRATAGQATAPTTANSTLNTTNWHFEGCVYTGDTNRRLLVDGAAALSDTASAGTTATPDSLSVGAVVTSSAPGQFFPGLINFVIISNVARSDGWVTTRDAATRGIATFSSASAPSNVTSNTAPVATITSQAGYTSYDYSSGRSITFTGTGTDAEDGTLTGASLVWTSSLDGALGTGVSVTKSSLSVGTHTITLTATDSQGSTGTATKTVVVKNGATWHLLKRNITFTTIGLGSYTSGYQVLVPASYNPATSYPLMMELGGSGQRGSDNTTQMSDGYAAQANANTAVFSTYGAFWVFPQWPALGPYGGREYAYPMIAAALASVQSEFNIDGTKLHLTGFSLGGQVAFESLYNAAPSWATLHVLEGSITNREGLLSGNDPAGTWSQAQAAAEVAGRNTNTVMIRQYEETSDTNVTPANAQVGRDAFFAVDPSHLVYNYFLTNFGTGHVAAYQAAQADSSLLAWAFGITRSGAGGGGGSDPNPTPPSNSNRHRRLRRTLGVLL